MGKSVHTPKDTVRERSGGLCEKCGVNLTPNVHGVAVSDTCRSIHHRQPQREGGRDSVINLVNLCWGCHKEIHEDEEKAATEGWFIPDSGTFPGRVPFLGHLGWVLPTSDGGLTRLDFETGRASVLVPASPSRTRSRRVADRARRGCRKSRKMRRAS